METILNVGGLIVHGELEKARAALKGLEYNGTRAVPTAGGTSCVGGRTTSRVPSTVSDYEECRDDNMGGIHELTSYSRSIETESSTDSIFLFAGGGGDDDSMSKDNSTLDELLKSTSSNFSRASHSQSDYSESMCTDLSNEYRQDKFERVASDGSQSEWCVRELPEEGAYSLPDRRRPSFASQCGEEVCLAEPTCSDTVKEEKPVVTKPSKGNRMSVQMERAKKGSRSSVKSPIAMKEDAPSSTTINAVRTTGIFKKTKPGEPTSPRTRRILGGAFFAWSLQNKSGSSTVKIGGDGGGGVESSASRTMTSPKSTDAISHAGSVGLNGSTTDSHAGSEQPNSSLASIQISSVPSPSGTCAADDKTENSKMDVRSCSCSCDDGKKVLSISTDEDNTNPSAVIDDNNDATSSSNDGGLAMPRASIGAWIEYVVVAVSPRNLIGDKKWEVVETARENTYEVILNCMDHANYCCDRAKNEMGTNLDLPSRSRDAEETVVLNQPFDMCGVQPTEELGNTKASKTPTWFGVHMPKFKKNKASEKESVADEESILMAHILDEINLEKEKLKQEKDKLDKEGGVGDELEAMPEEDIDLPQGFSDLIANEIAEEFGVYGLDDNKHAVHTLLHTPHES